MRALGLPVIRQTVNRALASLVLGGLVLAGLAFASSAAHAYILPLPASLAQEALSESVPTAIAPLAPNEFDAEDFSIDWQGAPPAGVAGLSVRLVPGSLQWVRVSEVLLVPRARAVLRTSDQSVTGLVREAGFNQVVKRGYAEFPVALLSGSQNPIRVALQASPTSGSELSALLVIRFNPRKKTGGPLVLLDPSCSRFAVRANPAEADPAKRESRFRESWFYVGCRQVAVDTQDQARTANLEMYALWDGAGEEIAIDGVKTAATLESLWPLRLASFPGEVSFVSAQGAGKIDLRYLAAQKLHFGALGLGLGPYSYMFSGPQDNANHVAPMLTVYGSYFVSETMRLLAFDASVLASQAYMDMGFYLSTEYVRSLDRRVAINLMLGAHVNAFRGGGLYNFKLGAPQGAEVIFSDFLAPGRNLTAGGFLYPQISGKEYYNLWLRYGSARFFGEINYIQWQETVGDDIYFQRSLGVSFGMPIARFW